MYGVGEGELDNLHLTVGYLFGAAIMGYTAPAVIALIAPVYSRPHILVLAIFHLIITVTDIVVYSKGIAVEQTLVAQTIYDTVISIVLLWFYLTEDKSMVSAN